ncbi:7085_t:CDS:2 [Acaulospora morrowiae]|uniref:7085_t:CDS:1 n=1 Tax=Acaulospora morrowiae TaxID=94023 RepID=A0A9N9HMX2_9GLOM|nr:7085_t:CDS:2 [Acaulospora morrowiae]
MAAKYNVEITPASVVNEDSVNNEVLGENFHYFSILEIPKKEIPKKKTPKKKNTCCGNETKSVMFMGPIKQVNQDDFEKWLREITPVPFVHIIKKPFNGYGHIHFDSYMESSMFYNSMKNINKESPYGAIRFVAAQFFSSKNKVTYISEGDYGNPNQITVESRKRKLIEVNDEVDKQLPYDIYETESEYVIVVDTPSVKDKHELSVSISNDRTICIKGNFSRKTIPGKKLKSEIPLPFGRLQREINLAKKIDSESVELNVEAGVTTVNIRKSSENLK